MFSPHAHAHQIEKLQSEAKEQITLLFRTGSSENLNQSWSVCPHSSLSCSTARFGTQLVRGVVIRNIRSRERGHVQRATALALRKRISLLDHANRRRRGETTPDRCAMPWLEIKHSNHAGVSCLGSVWH